MNILPSLVITFGLLFSTSCLADRMTKPEQAIYMDVVRQWHALPHIRGDYLRDDYHETSDAAVRQIYLSVASKHGVTMDDVDRILLMGEDQKPTLREDKIFGDLINKLKALPETATIQDCERIHRKIASHYGIAEDQLFEIEYRMIEGHWWLIFHG